MIRHGETTSNVSGVLDTGAPGPALTSLGHRQAAAAERALIDEDFDGVYVSELLRTHQTADPIARARGLDVAQQPGLEEVRAGQYEMRSDAEAVDGYLSTVAEWVRGNLDLAMPGAETGHEFLERYDAAIERITAQTPAGHSAVVISHGAAIRTWVSSRIPHSDDHPEATKMLHNTASITLEYRPGSDWKLIDWHSEPVGGRFLADEAARDPTRQPVGD